MYHFWLAAKSVCYPLPKLGQPNRKSLISSLIYCVHVAGPNIPRLPHGHCLRAERKKSSGKRNVINEFIICIYWLNWSETKIRHCVQRRQNQSNLRIDGRQNDVWLKSLLPITVSQTVKSRQRVCGAWLFFRYRISCGSFRIRNPPRQLQNHFTHRQLSCGICTLFGNVIEMICWRCVDVWILIYTHESKSSFRHLTKKKKYRK